MLGWNLLENKEGEDALRVVLDIPIGQRESEWTVMAVSIIVTLVGAAAAIYTVELYAPPVSSFNAASSPIKSKLE